MVYFVQIFVGSEENLPNVHQASAGGLNDRVIAGEKEKTWVSGVITHQFWFTRFMEGLHKRTGEVRKPDRVLTISELHWVEKVLEDEWVLDGSLEHHKRVAEMGVWFIVGFCCGLRGEEHSLIELAGSRNSLVSMEEEEPNFSVVLAGRVKGNQMEGMKVEIPCVAKTEGTGLEPGKRMKRLIDSLRLMGRTGGRLFHRAAEPSLMVEFEEDFFRVLEKVQSLGGISELVDVREQYGISRSIRRGATTYALNMQVEPVIIDSINRWRRSGEGHRVDMLHVYTELRGLKPTLLAYSRSL